MSVEDPIDALINRTRSRKGMIGWAAALCLGAGLLGTAFRELAPLFFVSYHLLLVLWVYLDATQRGSTKAWAFGILTLIANIFGLAVYLVARPEGPTDCPSCGAPMKPEYRVCPVCGAARRPRCPKCGQMLDEAWSFCPHCGERPAKAEPQPAQAAATGAPPQQGAEAAASPVPEQPAEVSAAEQTPTEQSNPAQ